MYFVFIVISVLAITPSKALNKKSKKVMLKISNTAAGVLSLNNKN